MGIGRVSRRAVLRAAAGVPFIKGVESVSGQQAFRESWHEFGFDRANTGYAPTNTGPAKHEERWNITAGRTISEAIAVTTDSVFVPGYDDEDHGFVVALSRETGDEKWRVSTNERIFSAPTYDSGFVYFGSEDGLLFAIDASDGSERWQFDAGAPISAAPKVRNGNVFFGTNATSAENSIGAVSSSDGSLDWSVGGIGWTRAGAIADDTFLTGTGSGVGAYGTDDGTERWQSATQGFVDVTPCVGNGRVYVGTTDGFTHAFDLSDGSELWKTETGERIGTPPSTAEKFVFVGDTGGTIYALDDRDDGDVKWEFQTGGELYSAPAIVGGTVFLGSWDNQLYALDRQTGDRLWRINLGDKVFSPVIADGEVYVGTGDGVAHAIGERDRTTQLQPATILPTRTHTTLKSPVTLQLTNPTGADYQYEWQVSAPDGSFAGLLHTSGEATALTPDVEGQYDVSVVVQEEDGTKLAEATKTIEAGAMDQTAIGGLPDFLDEDPDVNTVADLAERYAPVFHFHGNEDFFPTRLEAFVENADLHVASGDYTLTDLSLRDLGDAGIYDAYQVSDPMNRLHFPGSRDEMEAVQDEYPSTVYASVTETEFEGDEYVAVTYWCFYVLDPKKGDIGLLPDLSEHIEALLAAHTSDVESVTVLLDDEGPEWIAASQHKSGTYVEWEKVSKSAPTRIDVYPGVHAHSMFLVDTEAYRSSIPMQLRWLLVDLDNTRVFDKFGVSGENLAEDYYDVTASNRTWEVGDGWNDGEYDLAMLPGVPGGRTSSGDGNEGDTEDRNGGGDETERTSEAWLNYAGGFTSDAERDAFVPRRPIQHFSDPRRTEPGPWITDRMLSEPRILDDDLISVQLSYFSRTASGFLNGFTILNFRNPGKKPHTFIADIHIESNEGWVEENRIQLLPLGWDESTDIRIPLDSVSLPSDGAITVSVDILTYRPGTGDNVREVFHVDATAQYQVLPKLRLSMPDWDLSVVRQPALSDDVYYSLERPSMTTVHSPGSVVRERILVENRAEQAHTHYIQLTAVSEDGRRFNNDGAAGKAVRLEAGEKREISLTWEVSTDAPEGVYDILIEAWLEKRYEERRNLLARRRQSAAITVEKPDGTLRVDTSPSGAAVLVEDRLVGDAPVELTLPVGSYEVFAFDVGYRPATTSTEIRAGEASSVSLQLEKRDNGVSTADQRRSSKVTDSEESTGDPLAGISPEQLAGSGAVVAGLLYLAVRFYRGEN